MSPHSQRSRASDLSLLLLFIVSVFNYTDRYVIGILLPSIKADFRLSDTQMGFLTGIAFTFLYVLAGIPIARLADKYSRKALVSIALAIWSLTAALGGLARNFAQIAVMRTLVGLGEAGASPPAYSLISDLYPARQRATAMSVYLAGSPAGIVLGFVLGGWLTQQYGWRIALIVLGLPGLLYAIVLMAFLKEPERGRTDAPATQAPTASRTGGLRDLLRKPTFWSAAVGTGFYNALIIAYVNWLPSFFVRSHGLSIKQTGLLLALVVGPTQFVGVMIGGYVADSLSKRDVRWYVRFPASVVLVAMPLFMLSLIASNVTLAAILLALPLFIGAMQSSPPFAVTNSLVDARTRSVASAVLILIINVISGGVGPLAVGAISDRVAATLGTASLRHALLIVTPVFCLLASALFLLAGRYIRADLGRDSQAHQ
jgi:predicted MFS family arabinose efflux permease